MLKKIYYGWWIVLAAFWTLFICAGIGFSTLAVFLKFIDAEMHWGRGVISTAGALAALAAGFTAPLVGYIIDRYGPRAAMIPGVVVLSASFFLLREVVSPRQLYLLYLVANISSVANVCNVRHTHNFKHTSVLS